MLTKDELPPCPVATTLMLIGNKWKIFIIQQLMDRPFRFSELRREVGGVTPKVLTETLRSMERDGLVVRSQTPGVPPRVDYELTELGRSLTGPLTALRDWVQDHAGQVLVHRERHDAALA